MSFLPPAAASWLDWPCDPIVIRAPRHREAFGVIAITATWINLRIRSPMAMSVIANWSKAMTEKLKADQRVLRDDELDAVNGGAARTTAHIVTFTQSVSFSVPLHFGPILLPPSPC